MFLWLTFFLVHNALSLSFTTTDAGATKRHQTGSNNGLFSRSLAPRSLAKRDDPPNIYDFTWIKHYVAVGDSYAAGIGAGNALNGPGDKDCSRYDQAYPVLLNSALESDKFDNLACSGATSQDIRDKQINTIADGSADLITVSAGGNDVGFEAILKACVYLATDQAGCDKALTDGHNNVAKMRENIDSMVADLSRKVSKDGVIIYTMYAKFWNDAENYCDQQTWSFWDPLGTGILGLKLSHQNRQAMNKLTDEVNSAISSVVASARSSTREPIPVYAADWDTLVTGVKGRFCEDAASTDPAGNDDLLMFIRKNGISYNGKKRRSTSLARVRRSSLPDAALSRRNSQAADLSVRDAAAQTTATSGTSQKIGTINTQLNAVAPDSIARVFHPSSMGHQTITGPCMGLIVFHRSKTLKVDPVKPPQCAPGGPTPPSNGNPNCNSMKSGQWKATDTWVSQPAAAAAVSDFCKGGKSASGIPSGDLKDGKYFQQKVYYEKTVNELQLKVTFYANLPIDELTCTSLFLSIVDGCDVPHDNINPKNLKYGGTIDHKGGKNGGAFLEFNPAGKGAGADPQQFCNDNDTPTFLDAGVLNDNIRDFCNWISTASPNDLNTNGPSQPAKTYNDNSPNRVTLSAKWPLTGFRPTSGMCSEALNPLNGGCNVPNRDKGINPANKKHGGHLVRDVEYLFSIDPLTNNTVTDGSNFGRIAQPKTEKGDTGQGGKKIDKPTLQDCLRSWATSDWGERDCDGMVTFYFNRNGKWDTPRDCYNACSNGVSQMIDQGNKRTNCDATAGFTNCWLGYYVKE